jgi:uncharacterized protein (TIGR00661 family)
MIEREQPDLILTDFEPALPRAANAVGVPYASLNHQHFLLTYDLSGLPLWLRLHARYMAWVVRAYYAPPEVTIVSSFYFPPLRRTCKGISQVGVLLREEVEQAVPWDGQHLVAYFRRPVPLATLRALAALDQDIRVYGMGERPAEGRLRFAQVSADGFVRDLAGCQALVCTAGNQVVGEALSLGKPVFAIPELGNYEQYINAHYLARAGTGEWAELSEVSPQRVEAFLGRLASYRARIDRHRMNGLPEVLRLLAPYLDVRHGAPAIAFDSAHAAAALA